MLPSVPGISKKRRSAPELPPPSILDYRPRNTLVREEHLVPKAKYPVVDIHSHTGPTADTIDRLIKELPQNFDLGVSEKTVRNNVSNIFAKLHVADRAEAIVRARDAGLGT